MCEPPADTPEGVFVALRGELDRLHDVEADRDRMAQALQRSEAQVRYLFELSPLPYQSLDENGCFLEVNAAWCQLLGYTPAEVAGRWFGDLLEPESLETFRCNFPRFKAAGRVQGPEFIMRAKDGPPVIVTVSGSIERDDAGQFLKTHCILYDITSRRKALEALEASEKRYHSLYASMNEGLVLHEIVSDAAGTPVDYRLLDSNPAFERITGIPRKKAVGCLASELYQTGEPPFLSLYAEVARTGMPASFETTFAPMQKTFLIRAFSPAPGQFATVFEDITERKRIEQAMVQLNHDLERRVTEQQTLLDVVPMGIAIAEDSECRRIRVNSHLARLLGLPEGANASVTAPSSEMPAYRVCRNGRELTAEELPMQQSAARGIELLNLDVDIVFQDGRTLHFITSTTPLFDEEGRPRGCISAFLDITDRTHLEAQLHQAQKLESVGRLAGGIAHDFNNMLTAILGYAELAEEQLAPAESARASLENIRQAATRAANLTRQLLAFARKQIIEPRVVSLNNLMLNIESMLHRLIGEDITLVTRPFPGLGEVRIDPGQFEQIIVNLAINARDAMPDGGTLSLETANVTLDEDYARRHPEAPPGEYVMIAVSDTGMGMTEEVQARIFEPFFTTKEPGKGTGLGLATCYGIVKQNNGSIWLYSEPGRGSTFKIYLPRVNSSSAPDAESGKSMSEPGGTETILLVEDERMVRDIAAHMLERLGYRVLTAGDGEDALRIAEAFDGRIHLLITDVVMPQMGGAELARRTVGQRPDIQVIYTSGYTDNAIVHQGVLEPGVVFLQKPYTYEQLARQVRHVLHPETGA